MNTSQIKRSTEAIVKKILICQHGGSDNHGCEALARTVIELLQRAEPGAEITLYSYSVPEDRRLLRDVEGLAICGLDHLPGRYSLHNVGYHLRRRLGFAASKLPITAEFRELVDEADLVVAIGGDNYCYNQGRGYWELDRFIKGRGKPYILLGCSIEPDDLPRGLGEHLALFDCITVRESISMDAMVAYGLQNCRLIPDSAFLLEPRAALLPPDGPLPAGFEPEGAVGINVSPLVIRSEGAPGVTLRAFSHLVRHILETTDLQVALIPHVVWRESDDRQALAALAEAVGDTTDRLFVLEDRPSRVLKGVIGRLRFFVGARTHATIAAYSSGVPTLTLGYSVKARGIARDLFGQERGFVVPVQSLSREEQLTEAFSALFGREAELRQRLSDILPEYIASARRAEDCLRAILNGDDIAPMAPPDRDSVAGIIGKSRCTGCGACASACPEGCITPSTDGEGFVRPAINESACTGCGSCRRVCPAAKVTPAAAPRAAFAAAAPDEPRVLESSSGGVFGVLARTAMIEHQAVVFGAAFDENFTLRHMACESEAHLGPLLSSKYVQSDSWPAFGAVQRLLESGRQVLFCGTGCQVNALALLTPERLRERLTLLDVVCHGAPSPKVFEKYRRELEKAAGAPLTSLNFRDKTNGWQRSSVTATFQNGKRVSGPADEIPYMRLFLSDLSLRRSCYACPGKASLADLTLGDFWGIKHFAPGFDWEKGASLVLVRTPKGQAVLDEAAAALRLEVVSAEGPEKYNPCIVRSVARPQGRDGFFAALDSRPLAALAEEFVPKPSMKARLRGIIRK